MEFGGRGLMGSKQSGTCIYKMVKGARSYRARETAEARRAYMTGEPALTTALETLESPCLGRTGMPEQKNVD